MLRKLYLPICCIILNTDHQKMSTSMSYSNMSNDDDEANIIRESEIDCLKKTVVLADEFTLFDVLQKFKDQVRIMATKINQLDQYLNLTINPANPSTQQEILKVKRNIISVITHLLKDTKPLNYPSFQSLSSVKLLKMYEKISSECELLMKNIIQDNDNLIKQSDKFKNLSILIKDFQKEMDTIIAQNTTTTEIEQEVAREFKECKTDMYSLLSQLDSSSTMKEILSLLVERSDEDNEDDWLNIEDMPHLVMECQRLKKSGLVLQHEQNKYLFKLNI